MNRLVHLAILCCIIGLVSSCEKDPFLSLNSPNTIIFSEQGGTQKVSFTTNRDWTVSSSESWCMVSPSSGLKSEGELSFTVTCAPNTTFDSRSARVTIKAEELMETISVTQDPNLDMLVTQTSYKVSNEEQTIEIEVKANVNYVVDIPSDCKDWISHISTKSLTTRTLILRVSENKAYDNRIGHVTIRQIDGALAETITILQSQNNGLFITTSEYSLSNESHTLSIDVKANVEYEVVSQVEWIKIVNTKALTTSTITLFVDSNESYDDREASITVKQVGGPLECTIIIKQGQQYGLFVTTPEYTLSNEAHSLSVEVKANVEYEVKPKVDWIHYVETKGLMSSTINLYVDNNTYYDQRIGEVEVLQINGKLKGTIKVIQAERDKLLIDQDYYALSSDAQLITIGVESNIDYSVSSDVDWLSVSDEMAPEKIVVRVQNNYDSESFRIGHITFSQIDGDLFAEVTIAQDGISGTLYSKEPFFSECMDLLSLIWRLAGAPEYNECIVSKVSESADVFFASMKNHEAVRLAKEYRNKGVSYDAVATYGLYLLITKDGSIIFNSSFDGSNNSGLKRWPGNSKEDMLAALNDFYHKSDFHEWYTSLEPLHIQAIESFNSKTSIEYEWFDHFYGPVDKLSTQIILSILNGLSSYGVSTDTAYGGKLLSPVLGMFSQNNKGDVYYMNSNPIGVIHEFSHPYCNPLVDKYWESMKEKANAVFIIVESQMRSQAYSNAKTMMYETLVRACTAHYLITHGYGSDKERTIQNYESKGFVLVRCVVDALEKREQNWSKYPTLDDFMPEIIKVVNDYQL